ncbi:MAG TPA: MarC family protein [archaeon]|nr:MarC family protein [archaeon]
MPIAEFLTILISLFAITDPLGAVPAFMAVFGKADKRKIKKASAEAALAVFILLAFFSLLGTFILTSLGISSTAFLIAGGILLLVLAFDFISGKTPRTRTVEKEPSDVVVPIATPLLAGPGAITSSIYFTQTYGALATISSIIIVSVICFLFLFFSYGISRFIGKNGLKVLSRIMGIITAAIAISLIEKALVIYGVIRVV